MTTELARPLPRGDYSLTGKDTNKAIQAGLAEATWYASPVPKEQMRELLVRRDAPAFWGLVLWVALLAGFGLWGYLAWPSPWAILPFAIYAVLYASTSDARWHEMGHGTAFKTDWMNNLVYEVASFMVLRRPTSPLRPRRRIQRSRGNSVSPASRVWGTAAAGWYLMPAPLIRVY